MTDPQPKLYTELASWFHLLTSPADYDVEARGISAAFERLAGRSVRRVLELGSGGGNNASHLKARYEMTLCDLSPQMLETSRKLNPECRHVQGDMRHVRLGETFDAVLIHDAIVHLTTSDDVAAAIATAYAHLEPGGVLVIAPDDTVETFEPRTQSGGHDGEGRSMRYLMWTHPPDPGATWFACDFVYVTKEHGKPAQVVSEEIREGLLAHAQWLRLIADAGFEPHHLAERKDEYGFGACGFFCGVRP